MVTGINSLNAGTLTSLLNTNSRSNSLGNTLASLSTGLRINKAADDAAGMAIATQLSSQERSVQQAIRNSSDGQSVLNIAEGALGSITDLVTRGRELAMQASNSTLNNSQRQTIQNEYNQIRSEIDRISTVTSFNGQNLLDGSLAPNSTAANVQAGTGNNPQDAVNLNVVPQTNSASLGLANTDLMSAANAQTSLTAFDGALQTLSNTRGNIGALQNRLDSTISNLEVTNENYAAARSRIQDQDFAAGISNFTRDNLLLQVGYSTIAKSNQTMQQQIGSLLSFKA